LSRVKTKVRFGLKSCWET